MQYRADIEGLRALAVLLVLIFHFYPNNLTGGFIGVDIFFVISGFLITSIIYKKIIKKTFSFKEFYKRRIKRILPLLFIVIICTALPAYFILSPNDLVNYANSILYGSVSLSNLWFFNQDTYFAVSSMDIPLLQSWTLAVEEQYYLIWPFILFLCSISFMKYKKKVTYIVMAILFMLSVVTSVYCALGATKTSDFGYYFIFSRAYEFMVGSVLALVLSQNTSNYKNIIMENKATASLISFLGISAIIVSAVFYSSKLYYPSYYALLPCLGTVLFIWAGAINKNNIVSKLLSIKPMIVIGLLSYSLYLWQWPVLAFYRYKTLDYNINFVTAVVLLAAIIALSIIGYFCIERPARRSKDSFKSALIKYQIIPAGIVVIFSFFVTKTNGFENRINYSQKLVTYYAGHDYCHNKKKVYYTQNDKCVFGNKTNTKPRIILFGDSHAGNYSLFWDVLAKNYNFSIKIFTLDVCPSLLYVNNYTVAESNAFSRTTGCLSQIKYVTNNINDYDVFIFAGAWGTYFQAMKSKQSNGFNIPSFVSKLEDSIDFLQKHNKKVIIMGDSPNIINGNSIVRKKMFYYDCSIKAILGNNNVFSDTVIQDIAKKYKNTYYFNFTKEFMQDNSYFPYYNNIFVLKDDGHFNRYGSEALAKIYLSKPQRQQTLKKLLTKWGIISL